MSLLILGNEKSTTVYTLSSIRSANLYVNENDGEYRAEVKIKIERLSNAKVVYSETGDESIVAPAEKLYRQILDGMANDKNVNLSDFSLTEPKKTPAKKAPAKKTETETETETETPPEQPAE